MMMRHRFLGVHLQFEAHRNQYFFIHVKQDLHLIGFHLNRMEKGATVRIAEVNRLKRRDGVDALASRMWLLGLSIHFN